MRIMRGEESAVTGYSGPDQPALLASDRCVGAGVPGEALGKRRGRERHSALMGEAG